MASRDHHSSRRYGNAKFPVADSITTWQLSAAASTVQGNIGSGTAQFRSFQPFFAAFDPPSILTTGDAIALPITIRNYLDHPVSVQSSLTPAPWFRLDGPASSTMQIPSQASASPIFRFTALTPVIMGSNSLRHRQARLEIVSHVRSPSIPTGRKSP